jgi:hypothetical protein
MILLHAKSSVLRPTNIDKTRANSKLLDESNGLNQIHVPGPFEVERLIHGPLSESGPSGSELEGSV